MELEHALRRLVSERLRIYTMLAGVWPIIMTVLWQLGPVEISPLLYTVNAVYFVMIVGGYVLARRLTSSEVTGVAIAIVLVQLWLHARVAQEAHDARQLYMAATTIIGAGALVLHTRWMVCFVVSGTFIMVAGVRGDLLLFASASSVSLVIHLVLKSYVLRIEAQRRAVEAALADARHEIAERERVEAERQALQEQLLHAQKMESLGTLAGGFAHDMNNVLGGILAGVEYLRGQVPGAFRGELDDLIASTQRGAELTKNLLGFARRGQYRRERVELPALVDEIIRLLRRTVPKTVVFETAIDGAPATDGDRALLAQALVNLCLNAVDAMRGTGTIRIALRTLALDGARARVHDVAPGAFVAIEVRDTGCGMPPEVMAKVFEPFFTTKELGRGTGLGLAMVYGTMKSSGGAIEVASTVGTGTTFTMYVPVATSAAPVVAVPVATPPQAVDAAGTVLLVDDDPLVRRGARRLLERRGYCVHEAENGRDAIGVFEARRADIRLVVLDMAMPVMGGAECFRALRAREPALNVLLASGSTIEEEARACLDAGAAGFLEKPYTSDAFARAVACAIRGERVVA